MVLVAVAGGTGGIGKHIVEAILATKKHDIVVLSRSPTHALLESKGVRIAAVSYTDPASLDRALQGVHTVITTIGGLDYDSWVTPQLALLDAAKRSGVKRFVPSDWSFRGLPNDPIVLYSYKAPVEEALKKSGLEYTSFELGQFMNYLASGTPGVGYLRPLKFILDVENCSGMIPGDGNKPIVMTRAEDVGAFVAATLELPKWPEVSRMAGDRLTYNEILALAEGIRGQFGQWHSRLKLLTVIATGKKFGVQYVSSEELEKRKVADPPSIMVNFIWEVLGEMVNTDRGSYEEANLSQLCPDVKPVKVAEFLKTWWVKAE